MNKQKREYPDAFKEQAISLLRSSGRSASDVERELGITPQGNRFLNENDTLQVRLVPTS